MLLTYQLDTHEKDHSVVKQLWEAQRSVFPGIRTHVHHFRALLLPLLLHPSLASYQIVHFGHVQFGMSIILQ